MRAFGEAERANAYTRAYRLVPALRKDIEGDLPSNRVSQIQVFELGAHLGHHRLTNLVRQVELLKVVTFFPVAVASDRGDVEHALPKLDKGPTLHGDVQCRQVGENPVDEPLETVLSEMLH